VNRHAARGESSGAATPPIPTLKIDHRPEAEQIARVQALRARRSGPAAQRGVDAVRRACDSDENIMDAVLFAVKQDVTLGEICQVFREVFGEHRDPAYV
jgi:methylmalonyl-CoA mutase N-terminal domain/subunit